MSINTSELKEVLLGQLDVLLLDSNLEVSKSQRECLVKFILMLNKWNKAYNLSSVRDPEQMLIKHIMDSICVAPYVKGERIADVGTGPGLPGIPLAIMFPQKHFTLIDSLGKRIRFIKQCCHELGINNVVATQSRVEDIRPELPYDTVLSRAFASLNDMLSWCAHLVEHEGEFLALKGQLHDDELAQVPKQFLITDTTYLNVPGLEGERHVVSIKKTNHNN